jgi:hypothetical protein
MHSEMSHYLTQVLLSACHKTKDPSFGEISFSDQIVSIVIAYHGTFLLENE